jgi:nucleotide-binding universal stress UspA family protein
MARVQDILLALEGSASSERAIDLGITIARELPASLVGLAIVDEPEIRAGEATSIGGASYKRERDATLVADAHCMAEQWLASFTARCAKAGVSARVLEVRGVPAQAILSELSRHDLTMLGRDVNFRFATEEHDAATRDLILRRAGKPVLLVPEPCLGGDPVLIAYDDSLAARRALDSFAASGLAGTRPLHVAAMDDDGAIAWQLAEQGRKRLEELGYAASIHNIVSTLSIAEALLERRAQLGAGLIVLGAYTRSRLSRLLWGSVTAEMLTKSPVPLFLHY